LMKFKFKPNESKKDLFWKINIIFVSYESFEEITILHVITN